jgi:hypothetical protein
MSEYDPAKITELSTTTIVILMVFVPAIALGALIALSYAATT